MSSGAEYRGGGRDPYVALGRRYPELTAGIRRVVEQELGVPPEAPEGTSLAEAITHSVIARVRNSEINVSGIHPELAVMWGVYHLIMSNSRMHYTYPEPPVVEYTLPMASSNRAYILSRRRYYTNDPNFEYCELQRVRRVAVKPAYERLGSGGIGERRDDNDAAAYKQLGSVGIALAQGLDGVKYWLTMDELSRIKGDEDIQERIVVMANGCLDMSDMN